MNIQEGFKRILRRVGLYTRADFVEMVAGRNSALRSLRESERHRADVERAHQAARERMGSLDNSLRRICDLVAAEVEKTCYRPEMTNQPGDIAHPTPEDREWRRMYAESSAQVGNRNPFEQAP